MAEPADGEDADANGHVEGGGEFIEESTGPAVMFAEVSCPAAVVAAMDKGSVGAGADSAEVEYLGFG
jgi:hypothetical protein